MRSRILFVVVVTVLAALFILWRQKREASVERAEITSQAARASTQASANAPRRPERLVRRLSEPDRAVLAEQIKASIAKRVAAETVERPSGPAGAAALPEIEMPLLTLEEVGPELKRALDEAIPIIGECYERIPGSTHEGSDTARVAIALMVMTSDPDLGTVVDADKLTEEDGTPLDGALETCLRDTIQSLALPPIGKPGKLPLQYSFRSDDK